MDKILCSYAIQAITDTLDGVSCATLAQGDTYSIEAFDGNLYLSFLRDESDVISELDTNVEFIGANATAYNVKIKPHVIGIDPKTMGVLIGDRPIRRPRVW